MAALVDVAPGDPPWAQPYVPAIGQDWHEHAERTMRGMMADLGARLRGWGSVWWTEFRHPTPSGSDANTWVAVWPGLMGQTGLQACMHFRGWDRQDVHGRKVRGAPVRIAVYPGLWRKRDIMWSFGCRWDTYAHWCEDHALAGAWLLDAGLAFHGVPSLLLTPDGDRLVREARKRADEMRQCGWMTRSAMLQSLADDRWPNGFLRELNSDRLGYPDRDVWAEAQAMCWREAEDDLPWPAFEKPRPKPLRPVALSLFDDAPRFWERAEAVAAK